MANRAAALLTASVVSAAAGCALTTTRVVTSAHSIRMTRPASRPPLRVVKRVRVVRAGQSAELLHAERVQGRRYQIDLVMKAGKPSVSHSALSSYAYGPANGNYLTFVVSIRNRGQAPVLIEPTDFYVDVGGSEQHITSYDGNAKYDGARQQLDATQLLPHESLRKPLTFDVSRVHGTLTYAPERRPAIRWRF